MTRPTPIARFIEPDTHATDATFTGKAVDTAGARNLRVVVKAPTTGTPVGKLKLQGSEDYGQPGVSTPTWFDVKLPDGSLDGSGFTDPAGDTTEVDWDGTTALKMAINVLWPYRHMRLVYTRTSGGSASVFFSAHAGLR